MVGVGVLAEKVNLHQDANNKRVYLSYYQNRRVHTQEIPECEFKKEGSNTYARFEFIKQ